jgi:ribose-phosphate pyrophosphokinase
MKIVAGTSNPDLAAAIAKKLGIEQISMQIAKFPNGEKRVWIQDEKKVRGERIVVVQSFSNPTDENIIEFLLITDALERMGARSISLVLPWMGYSFQDKVFRPGEPIAAKVIADLVSNAFIKRCFLLDLHNSSIPAFFSVPTDYVSAMPVFTDYVKKQIDLTEAVVASPDFGGLKRARSFAAALGLDLVNIDKHRDLRTGRVTAMGVHGNVFGRTVILFDDAILSGGTVVEAAALLKEQKAKQIYFLATHGLFVNKAQERLQNSAVDQIIITNSIHQTQKFAKLKILNVAPLFADRLKDWI